jgi:hypothetical protein
MVKASAVEQTQEDESRLAIYLKRGVVVADPSILPGLASEIEAEAVPSEGVPYDTKKTTGERVDCALCKRRNNHFKGFVVTFEDGRRATIGIVCAEENLFATGAWDEMVAKAERRKQAVLYEERLAPTLAKIDELMPILVRCEGTASIIDTLIGELHFELPDLYSGIIHAAMKDRALKRDVARKVTVIGVDGIQREVNQYSNRTFAVIPSRRPFENTGLRGPIRSVSKALIKVKALLSDENVTLIQQAEAFRKLRNLRRDLSEAYRDCRDCEEFLSMTFWDDVCKWGRADEHREGNYRIKKRLVRHSDAEGVFGQVEIPDPKGYNLTCFVEADQIWPNL